MILTNMALKISLSIVLTILSYIIGSMPFGIWIGKSITKIDVREHGSKNIGTTNVIRVLGKKVGFLVFFFDVLKGAFVIVLVRLLFERFNLVLDHNHYPYIIYGAAAIFGHSFSVFLKFKGGKSVATSLGVVIALCPMAAIACLIVFGVVLLITGYVSLCSTFAAIAVVIVCWILYFFGFSSGWILENPGLINAIVFSCIALFLIWKHRSNYKRLLNGTENSFKKKKNIEKNVETNESNDELEEKNKAE